MYPGMNYPMLPIKTQPSVAPNLSLGPPALQQTVQPFPDYHADIGQMPLMNRMAPLGSSPIRQQIAQQMTMPNVSRGTRRTIQPVMPGTGMY